MTERLTREVEALDNRMEEMSGKLSDVESQLARATARRERLAREEHVLDAAMRRTKGRLAEVSAAQQREQAALSSRVAATYRQGNWFYIEVLLGSDGFADLLTRAEFVERVLDANAKAALALEVTGREMVRERILLDRTLSSMDLKRAEASAVAAQLKRLRSDRRESLGDLAATKAKRTGAMRQSKRNMRRLQALADAEEAESRRIEAELAALSAGIGDGLTLAAASGTLMWPVPQSRRITSPFGWRTCPFHGRERHSAVDIGAPEGSEIVAAKAGTVIYAGYRGAYGNLVMVDHGEGVVTLYPHQAAGAVAVRAGQTVAAGERIGGVGATGNATGPHLHFEVRMQGVPQDPGSWL